MMKTLIAILPAMLCLWIAGCTPASTREALVRADSIMVTVPDSALAILDALDPATLNSDGTMAMYAVSLTEARHMAYVPVYDDSLITMGADYYLTHGSSDEKARAFYYSAIVRYNNSNYEQAIVDGLRAEKLALTTSDHLRLGLTYRTIADCFDRLYDWSSALHYYRLSYGEFCHAPDNIYTDWALLDIARGEMALDNYDEAAGLLALTDSIAKVQGNTPMAVTSLSIRAKCDFNRRDFKGAIRALEGIRQLDKDMLTADHYRTLGVSYATLGDIASAKACRDSLSRLQPGEQSVDYAINRVVGNYDVANSQLEHIVDSTNVELYKILKRNYAEVISKFYGLEEKAAMEQISKSKMTLVSVIIVTIILLAFGYMFFRYRTNLLSSQIEARISEAQNLEKILFEKSSQLDDMKTDRDKLVNKLSQRDSELERIREESHRESTASVPAIARDEIRYLLAGRFEHLDRLCSVYFQFKGQSNEKDKISSEVLEIINGIQYDDKIKAKLEETINGNLGDVMVRFRKDFPSVKERDYMLFMFLILDFSPRAISILQDLKTEVVYNHKSKLKRKISASNSEYKDEYLSYTG